MARASSSTIFYIPWVIDTATFALSVKEKCPISNPSIAVMGGNVVATANPSNHPSAVSSAGKSRSTSTQIVNTCGDNMTDLPRRESSPEEDKANQELKQREYEKQRQKNRIEENRKIRCPCCKKNQYFDQYLANKELGCLLCSNCGILFIDKHKLKTIKANLAKAKQTNLIQPAGPTINSPIIKP